MQKNAITPEGQTETEADKSPDTKDPKDLLKADEKEGQSVAPETAEDPKGSGREKLLFVAAHLMESSVMKLVCF